MPKKTERKTLTISSIALKFSDEQAAYQYLESILWKNGVICPHCGTIDKAHYVEPKTETRTTRTGSKTYRRIWWCAECRKEFSVLVGTIFEDSKIPLSKWLLAVHELSADKNGISSCELARKLDITQKSAWHMAHRIRLAFARPEVTTKLQGTVEADETYFGGKAKFMHKDRREKMITARGTVGKVPVFSVA